MPEAADDAGEEEDDDEVDKMVAVVAAATVDAGATDWVDLFLPLFCNWNIFSKVEFQTIQNIVTYKKNHT